MKGLAQSLWEPLAHAGLDFLEKARVNHADDYLLNGIVVRLNTLSAPCQARWANLAARWIGCTKKPRDVISLLDNCRKFLPEERLAQIRPTLEAANRQRADLPPYDWEHPYYFGHRESV
jgi:hypothetical protein